MEKRRSAAENRPRESKGDRRATGAAPGGERLGLAERLVLARQRRRLRQLDAAREIGVCRETINRIEGGYVAAEWTRSRVRAWLEAQEEEEERRRAAGQQPPAMR